MKRMMDARWAHIVYALLVPEAFFRDPDGRDGVASRSLRRPLALSVATLLPLPGEGRRCEAHDERAVGAHRRRRHVIFTIVATSLFSTGSPYFTSVAISFGVTVTAAAACLMWVGAVASRSFTNRRHDEIVPPSYSVATSPSKEPGTTRSSDPVLLTGGSRNPNKDDSRYHPFLLFHLRIGSLSIFLSSPAWESHMIRGFTGAGSDHCFCERTEDRCQ
uniref:Uncharacterized protein n=1 Tax=Oryza glumipatula TaxID=40148 RepID=A0A0E0BI67_9ORYZ